MNPLDDKLCVESIKKVTEIFGGKWSFIIMGELNTRPKCFNELSKKLGISTKSLSYALKSLESNGVIARTVMPTTPVIVEYSLTEKGRDFERVFIEMKEWVKKWLI